MALAGAVPLILGCALLLALAAFVLRAAPRDAPNRALALLFLVTGVFQAALVVAFELDGPVARRGGLVVISAGLVDGILLTGFALVFFASRGVRVPRLLAHVSTYAILSAIALAIAFGSPVFFLPSGQTESWVLLDNFLDIAWMAVPVALVQFARMRPAGEANHDEARSVLILAAGIACVYAYLDQNWVDGILATPGGDALRALGAGFAAVRLGLHALLLVLLVEGAMRAERPRRNAFRLALVVVAGATLLRVVVSGTPAVVGSSAGSLAFAAMPVLASYALLRHQLLGIDVRLHAALVRAIVAGFFLVVFTLVEQLAQVFVSDALGYAAGLLAGLLLLLLLSPLGRLARRLADRAIPGAGATSDLEQREAAYRHALRICLRHEHPAAADLELLAGVARRLKIEAGRAEALRREVDAETAHP